MTEEEFGMYIEEKKKLGYMVVKGNDSVGDGVILFGTQVHSRVPSPVSFAFLRLRPDGELKEVFFKMPTSSWKSILLVALEDIL